MKTLIFIIILLLTVSTAIGEPNFFSVGKTTVFASGACGVSQSNDIVITVYPSSKDYLTDEEFKLKMSELQVRIGEVGKQTTDEYQSIMDLLNRSDNSKNGVPNDVVSVETFNDMMNDLYDNIDAMRTKNESFFDRIMNKLIQLFR